MHTTGGLPHAGGGDAPDDLRHPRGRRLLVRRGHRMGHGALVHRVRPARQPHHRASSTRARRTGRTRIASGRSSRSTGRRSCTPRRPRSGRSCGGDPSTPRSTTCPRCGCSGRSVSRSTRRRGSGTGRYIGGERCPVVDTWWQTETGAILITPLPGITALKPGSATFPFPSIVADIVDEKGSTVPLGGGGYLVLKRPVAVHREDDLGRSRTATSRPTSRSTGPRSTSRATARSGTRTGTSGCSAGSTT